MQNRVLILDGKAILDDTEIRSISKVDKILIIKYNDGSTENIEYADDASALKDIKELQALYLKIQGIKK